MKQCHDLLSFLTLAALDLIRSVALQICHSWHSLNPKPLTLNLLGVSEIVAFWECLPNGLLIFFGSTVYTVCASRCEGYFEMQDVVCQGGLGLDFGCCRLRLSFRKVNVQSAACSNDEVAT